MKIPRKYIHERELWLVNLEPTKGIEIRKLRPVLVLRKFSKEHFIILPITSKKKNTDFYFEIKNKSLRNGSFIALAQIRAVDVSRFGLRSIGKISRENFINIKNKMAKVLKLPPSLMAIKNRETDSKTESKDSRPTIGH